MARSPYQQYCPIACGLDLVGERWTLLVIRELLLGPKRFTDLLDGLGAIGPNILTTRLRALESDGLLRRRRLPPPAASTVYELTDLGLGLEPALLALGRWGLQLLPEPAADDDFRTDWVLLSLKIVLPQRLSGARDVSYLLTVDDTPFAITVADEVVAVAATATDHPDMTIETDRTTFRQLGLGRLSFAEAVPTGRVRVAGDLTLAEQLVTMLTSPSA